MMQGQDTLMASSSVEWGTPDSLFTQLAEWFGPFDMDVAATRKNAKCERFYTEKQNGLEQPWYGIVFCNPPYGRQATGRWIDKAIAEVEQTRCRRAVLLVPARTDTRWFHDKVFNRAAVVVFLKGRIQFEQKGKHNSAPFPSMVVVYDRLMFEAQGMRVWSAR